jgi:hypothetical protein
MTVLDLSFDADLSINHSKIFNALARSKIKNFNKIIGKLYSNVTNENFLLWVISNTSSRNPYSSKIFYYYLSYFFLKKILKYNKFKTVIVDSVIQKKIYQNIIKKNNKNIKIILKEKKSANTKIRFLKFFLRFLLIKTSKFFGKKKIISKELSLIMTYVLDGYILKSRYFPYLYESIKKKKNIFFVPNIVIFKFSAFIKNLILLRNEKNYILKEDYISYSDLFSIFKINLKIKKIFKKKYFINDFLLSDLVVEELLSKKNTYAYLESYMNFLFIKNLKTMGIDIKTSIVWFENQSFERSWSYALNKYHKNTKNIGYMGIVPADMYISQDHTLPEDRKFHTIPKTILTVGNYFKDNIKKYDSNLITKTVSALNFQHLFKKQKTNKKKQILVALPILKNDSDNILKICKDLMDNEFFFNFKLIVRPHPTSNLLHNEQKLKKLDLKGSQIDYNQYFFDSLRQSSFFFGGMSSTCLEAIMLNVPTIIFKSNDYLSSSCIPKLISDKCYLYSNDYKEISKFIIEEKNKKKILSNKIRNNCFKIVSNNLMNEFNL